MQLPEYLAHKGLKLSKFARLFGEHLGRRVRVQRLHKYCRPKGHPDHRMPESEMQTAIREFTQGAVDYADWHSPAPTPAPRPAGRGGGANGSPSLRRSRLPELDERKREERKRRSTSAIAGWAKRKRKAKCTG